MEEFRPLKRVWVKEEFVVLTGDVRRAVVLDQFLRLHSRVHQYDEVLRQEFGDPEVDEPKYRDGWIRQSVDEMVEESMLGGSRNKMREDISKLVDGGWLERRQSPSVKVDKTYEYRVQVGRIAEDLHRLGYALEGYTVPVISTKKDGDQ